MKNLIKYFIVFCSFQGLAQVQSNIKIGEQIEDLVIQNIEHFGKKQLKTDDLLGKWTILDFWTTGCTACVKGFPKLNDLQQKFPQIQFVLITDNSTRYYRNIRQVFERLRKNMDLNLPIAYDSLLFKRFAKAVPFFIVLDPEGKVHSIPWSTDINEKNLNKLVANELPFFGNKVTEKKERWKYWIETNKLDSNNATFQSLLTPYQNEWSSGKTDLDADSAKGLYQVTGVTAARLYMVASNIYNKLSPYKNEYWHMPVLEDRGSVTLWEEAFADKNVFNYSLLVPKFLLSEHFIRQKLSQDLNTYFNAYAKIEIREMPYLKLSSLPGVEDKLRTKTKNGSLIFDSSPTGLNATGININVITSLIYSYSSTNISVVDETNIKALIDIKFEAIMTDLKDVQKALRKHGLILEEVSKPMRVLVIRPKSNIHGLSKMNSNEN